MADRTMNLPEDSESAQAKSNAKLDARITLALETAPRPQIPTNFAARLAAQLPAIAPVTVAPRQYGRNAAIVCVAILLVLIFLFARRPAVTSPVWVSLELVFCIQFAFIAVVLALPNGKSYFRWLS